MSVKVSMVIPCYNKDKYIGDMLESVLKQKWDNIEVIIVNDGSTDGTFNAIERYVPKFLSRGFEVVLVNQENLGVASAVKNGLMRVTGKYVCFPDCDDLLHHEYVSAMVEVLENYPEVDIAVCDNVRNQWNLSPHFGKKEDNYIHVFRNSESLIPEWLLGGIMPSVCVMLIRFTMIKEVKIIESFFTNICTTQEPQIWLPLLTNGRSICYIKRALYKSIRRNGSIMTSQMTVDKIYYYAETRKRLIHAVLKANVKSEVKLEYYCKLADIAFFDLVSRRLSQINPDLYAQREFGMRFVTSVNSLKILPSSLQFSTVEKVGFRIVYCAVNNYLTGYTPQKKDILTTLSKIKGRLIAYGAGNVAKQILPIFMRCNITPSIIWDKNSIEGEKIFGIMCSIPDFGSLTKTDTILLLLNGNKEVEEELKKYNVRVLYYMEVVEALVNKYFPEIMGVNNE